MRLVVVDNNMTGYVYNPVDSTMLEIKNFPHDAENLLWDMKDANVFVVIGKSEATTFRYRPVGLRGQSVEVVPGPSADNKNTKRPSSFSAMVLHGGEVTFQVCCFPCGVCHTLCFCEMCGVFYTLCVGDVQVR